MCGDLLGFLPSWYVNEAISVLWHMVDWHSITETEIKDIRNLTEIVTGGAVLAVVPNPLVLMKKFTANSKWLIATTAMLIWGIWHLNNYSEFLYFQF